MDYKQELTNPGFTIIHRKIYTKVWMSISCGLKDISKLGLVVGIFREEGKDGKQDTVETQAAGDVRRGREEWKWL